MDMFGKIALGAALIAFMASMICGCTLMSCRVDNGVEICENKQCRNIFNGQFVKCPAETK